ncbi:hypothetical protein ACET3X_007173 [Alternaria dauci]|uniref:Uncharacterized protein n=1 Tax=Alternaria dauci TaxID=48095 RepID=A0ABR3UGM4_9PLEO
MKLLTTLLTLAVLFAVALSATVPTASDRLRGPLKPKPSNVPDAIVERLVADDANTQLIAEYLQTDDNDVQADESTTTTCQKCAQVYKDCKNRCHTDANGQNCDIVCINIACDASVDGGQCGNTCHWKIC